MRDRVILLALIVAAIVNIAASPWTVPCGPIIAVILGGAIGFYAAK